MKIILLILIILFHPFHSFPKNIVVEGRIGNFDSKEPLAYVNVAIAGTYYGTVSSSSGEFNLVIPDKFADFSISFSAIGFEKQSIPISSISGYLSVSLKALEYQINEVIVMPDSSLRVLLKNAYNKIPENYPDYSTRSLGFYRESSKEKEGNYLYITESILDVYKTSYKNKSDGQVKLVKSRMNKLPGCDSINQVHFYGGLFTPHKADIVKNRVELLKPSKNYHYKLKGMEMYNGREVYCISFHPIKPNEKGKIGVLYIDKESLAYVKFDYHLNDEALKWREKDQPLTFLSSKEERFVKNYENINGKYYFKSDFYSAIILNKETNYLIGLSHDYIMTELTADNADKIPYQEQVSYTSIIADIAEDYQVTSWKDYTILKDESIDNSFMSHQQSDSILNRVNSATKYFGVSDLLKIVFRFEYELNFIAYPLAFGSNNYSMQVNTLNGNHLRYDLFATNSKFSYQYEIAMKYKLSKYFKLWFNSGENILSTEESSCNSFGLEYCLPLKTYGRHVYFSTQAGYGFLKLMKSMGTVENNNAFDFSDTHFDSKEIKAYRGIKINGIRLASDLSFQLSSRTYLKIFGGWQFDFQHTDMVRLEEKDGFFLTRESTEEDLLNENITSFQNNIEVSNSQFDFQNYFVGVGLKISY